MAYSITQAAPSLCGADDSIFIVVKDTTNTGEEKYRYVCQVTVNSSVIGTFRQLPNNAECGAFSLNSIASAYVEQEAAPWRLGKYTTDNESDTAIIFANNSKSIETISLNFGYEFSIISGDSPTEVLGLASQDIKVTNGTYQAFTLSSNTSRVTSFGISGVGSQLLSDVPLIHDVYPQWVGEEQFGALAFLNGDDVGSDDSGYVIVTYYDSSDAELNQGYFENTSGAGGFPPDVSLTDGQSLLYFGCFPANLEAQTIVAGLKPSDVGNNGWAYYDVMMSSSSVVGGQSSAKYRFHKSDCHRFTPHYTLAWWNSVGGVDQLLFDGLCKVTQKIERTTYRERRGNAFDADGTTTPYISQSYEGGLVSLKPQTSTMLELTTIEQSPEHLQPLIGSLINSERVYAYGKDFGNLYTIKDGYVRVIVKENTLTQKVGRHDGYVSYSVKVEVSRFML